MACSYHLVLWTCSVGPGPGKLPMALLWESADWDSLQRGQACLLAGGPRGKSHILTFLSFLLCFQTNKIKHGLKYSTALALWNLEFIDKTDASGKCKGWNLHPTLFQNVLNTLSGYCLYPAWVPDDGGGNGNVLGNHSEGGQPSQTGSSRLNQCIFPF